MNKVLYLPLLDAAKIQQALAVGVQKKLSRLNVVGEISSTSDYVFDCLPDITRGAVVCLAERQTAGRGRNGREWVSPQQANIYLSLGYQFRGIKPEQLSCLSLALGVAVCDWLEGKQLDVKLKWPNDILAGGKKLAGMLIESRIQPAGVVVVIGIGLNVMMPENEIDQPWTDLAHAMNDSEIDRDQLSAELIEVVLCCCEAFDASGFAGFHDGWKKYNLMQNREVEVVEGEEQYRARVLGLDADCALKVGRDGQIRNLYAADIKLKMGQDDND